MGGVCSEIKTVNTKFDKVTARLETSWVSYPGSTDIYFLLIHEYQDEFEYEFVKEYTLTTGIWKTGMFDNSDVLEKYGERFDNWVKNVNKKSYVIIEGRRVSKSTDYPLVKPRKKRYKDFDW